MTWTFFCLNVYTQLLYTRNLLSAIDTVSVITSYTLKLGVDMYDAGTVVNMRDIMKSFQVLYYP